MKKYAKIIDDKTKACIVGLSAGCDDFYKSEGLSLLEVEEGYDGSWYVAGFSPQKPIRLEREEQVRRLLHQLRQTDYIALKIAENESLKEKYAKTLALRQSWRDQINSIRQLMAESDSGLSIKSDNAHQEAVINGQRTE